MLVYENSEVSVNLEKDGKTVNFKESYKKPSDENDLADLVAELFKGDEKQAIKYLIHGYDIGVLRPKIRRVVEQREGGEEKIIQKFAKNFESLGIDETTALFLAREAVAKGKLSV